METTFVDVVENVKNLSNDEKIELKGLLDKYLTEERRNIVLENYYESLAEFESGTLAFSSDSDKLLELLND